MADSALLKLTLMDYNSNVDQWGQILNDSVFTLLENAVAGTAEVLLTDSNPYSLPDTNGDEANSARNMILNVSGTTGGATDIIVPTRSKLYLVANNTTDTILVKTIAGAGITILQNIAVFVYCDGTNVVAASVDAAQTAINATLASNSDALVGVAGADFAQKAVAQTFTAGQMTERDSSLSPLTGATLQIDCSLSNTHYVLLTPGTQTFQLQAPVGATNGQTFTLILEQGAGGPHTISFAASTFRFAGGTTPVLSTVAGDVDYLAFEYCNDLSTVKWLGTFLKDMSEV